jgi:uncharacterized iron-regulated protein
MEEFHAGQIIEAATGRALVVDQLITQVLQQDVVYLGEEHHNRFHIEAALAILKGVTVAGRRPILAMEMFGWDGQAVLDRYLSTPEMNRQDFLDQVRWTQNWGGPFEDYEPLVQYARTQRLRLITMNPPKSLVRAVAKQGLDPARQSVELSQWNMDNETIVDDPAYRARILQQLRACHDAGPDALYQTMYEASMVRDEGMARTIVSQVQQLRAGNDPSAGPVVSYTGGGHIQYNLPVPKRVARRLDQHIRQLSIYMTSFEKDRIGDLKDMLKERIADYVWLTSVSPQGPPRRCR